MTTAGVFTALFAAIVYAVGVISEFVGELAFRRLFDTVRGGRFQKYLDENRGLLEGDPILGRLAESGSTKRELGAASECVGQMRFQVLIKSPSPLTGVSPGL